MTEKQNETPKQTSVGKTIFGLITFAGSCYLIYLGIKLLTL